MVQFAATASCSMSSFSLSSSPSPLPPKPSPRLKSFVAVVDGAGTSGASVTGAGGGDVISPSESLSLSSWPPNAKKESGSFFFAGGRVLPFFAGVSAFFGCDEAVGAFGFFVVFVFCRFGCLINY